MDSIQQMASSLGYKDKEVNGSTYSIKLIAGREGMRTAIRLSKLVIPSVGAGIDGISHDDLIHGAPKTFSEASQLFVNQMEEEEILDIIEKLFIGSSVNGSKLDFDSHFAGNYGNLVSVIEFALRENFESFFMASGLKTKVLGMVNQVLAMSTSPEQEKS